MSAHACEWCGTTTDGRKATCSSAHRGARWRWLKGISNDPPPWADGPLSGRYGEAAAVQPAPAQPAVDMALQAVASANVAQVRKLQRERNAATARADRLLRRATTAEGAARSNGDRAGSNARSGIMLSHRKAVRAAVHAVNLAGHPELAGPIERALTDALAPTQRRKLEARDAG